MAKRKGPSDSDVETLEPPPEGLPDTTGEEAAAEDAAVEHGDTLDIRALHDIKIPQLPYNLVVRDVKASEHGLAVSATAANVPLSGGRAGS